MEMPELKAGMIVEHIDGSFGIVFPEINKILFQDGYAPLFVSDNNTGILSEEFSAVYEVIFANEIGDCFDKNNLKCIWKPEKEYKGFAEIAKALLEGKKLRCKHWHSSFYIHIKDNKLYENDIELSSLWIAYPMVEYKE